MKMGAHTPDILESKKIVKTYKQTIKYLRQ